MEKNILLINDLAGVGKVALSAMIPTLSLYGHRVHTLPTALVSNTLDYGVFIIHETTDYMEEALACWKKLNFQFDCICTGFLVSKKQAELVEQTLAQRNESCFALVDPIMGDEGQLYPGVDLEVVERMRSLAKQADLILPNLTEAAFLTDNLNLAQQISRTDCKKMIDQLRSMGSRNVVISSVILKEDDKNYVCGYSAIEDEYFELPYLLIPVRFPGTGDIFSSVLVGRLFQGCTLKQSVQFAMDEVYHLILTYQNEPDPYRGLPLERNLATLCQKEK